MTSLPPVGCAAPDRAALSTGACGELGLKPGMVVGTLTLASRIDTVRLLDRAPTVVVAVMVTRLPEAATVAAVLAPPVIETLTAPCPAVTVMAVADAVALL